MNSILRKFIRESMISEGTSPAQHPDVAFDPSDESALDNDANLATLVESYKYISDHLRDFATDAKAELDKNGGIGVLITRWDLEDVQKGFIEMLRQDQKDIQNTMYPMRTAIFLTGVLDGSGITEEEILDIMGGCLDEIAGGFEIKESRSRKVYSRSLLSETMIGSSLEALSKVARAALSAGKTIAKFYDPRAAAAIEKAIAESRGKLVGAISEEAATKLSDEIVFKISEMLKRDPAATKVSDIVLAAIRGEPEAIELIKSQGGHARLTEYVETVFYAVKTNPAGYVRAGSRALWKLSITQVASVLGSFALWFASSKEAEIDQDGLIALVGQYAIRTAVADARDSLSEKLRSVWAKTITVGPMATPKVLGSELADAIDGLSRTCLPGPNGKPFVSSEDLNSAIQSFVSIGAR